MALFRRPAAAGEPVSALITRCARETYPDAEIDEKRRRLFVPIGGGRAGINLDSLTARLEQSPPAEHERLVRSWLATIGGPLQDVRVPDDAPPVVADLLRLRVTRESGERDQWDADALPGIVSEAWPHGFRGVVVYPDDDGRPAYLAPRQAAAYGGEDEALRLAVHNTVTQELVGLEPTIQEVDGHPLRQFHRPGNPFMSALVTVVRHLLPAGNTAGGLVIAPSYDEVILLPVSRRTDVDAVPMLAAVARERHAAAADPCVDHVCWWHDDTLFPLTVTGDGGSSTVVPAALRGVMQSLPAS